MQNTSMQTREIEQFKQKLKDSFLKEVLNYPTLKIPKNSNVYIAGDKNNLVYFIESGQIKLVVVSPEGKECILAIHSVGDIFGELCMGERLETAKTMTDSQLKPIIFTKFIAHLGKELLLEGFVKYLAVRVGEQQQVIANLVNVDSEQRTTRQNITTASKIHW